MTMIEASFDRAAASAAGLYLTRPDPLPPPLGRMVPSRDDLQAVLDAIAGPVFVSDLSLGSWRPHHLATELSAQAGLGLPYGDKGALQIPNNEAPQAEQIGAWVDAEGRGDLAAAIGYHAVRAIGKKLCGIGAHFLVMLPEQDRDFRDSDVWTLYFLRALCATEGHTVTLLYGGRDLPAHWQSFANWQGVETGRHCPVDTIPTQQKAKLGCLPNVLTRSLAQDLQLLDEMLTEGIPVRAGLSGAESDVIWLVPPEFRTQASSKAAGRALALSARTLPWLRAYACQLGEVPDAPLWIKEAWRCFGLGAYDLALCYAGLAADHAPTEQVKMDALLADRTIRLVGQDYVGLARPIPSETLFSDKNLEVLRRYQGWGQTLTGDGQAALDLFGPLPGKDPVADVPCLDLYLRNIYALALFRAGRADDALALEHDIDDRLAKLHPISWHLRYLNALNISRLYKARGDHETARDWVATAHQVNIGNQLPSDDIHFHILFASLDETCGQRRAAFNHWFAAALLFVSLPLPEIIGWRVAAALPGRASKASDPESLCRVFLDKLTQLSDSGSDDLLLTGDAPSFLPAELDCERGPLTAVGALGWGVLASHCRFRPAIDTPLHSRLRQVLSHQITRKTGRIFNSFFIDIRHGSGLCTTLDEHMDSALWHGAEAVIWEGQSRDMDALLGTASQSVRLSPGVSRIEGNTVYFKRYRRPQEMSAEAMECLSEVVERDVGDLTELQISTVIGLVRRGVLTTQTRLAPRTERRR